VSTAQVRYRWIIGNHLHFTGGIEEPDSQISSPTGGAKQTFPHLTLRARYEAFWGHVHLAGVLRQLAVNDGAGADDHTGGYVGYTHYWAPTLSSTEVAGWLEMDNESFQAATAFRKSEYCSANLIWNPYGSLNVGAWRCCTASTRYSMVRRATTPECSSPPSTV
jgi:hypothetical protein